MRHFSTLGALAILTASPVVHADNEYDMNMPCFNDICWTSWRCWYARYSKYDNTIGERCGLPDNAYTQSHDGGQWNTLVWEEEYKMEWTSSYAAQDEDIVLEWLMYEAPGTEIPIPLNETNMYPDYWGNGSEKFVVAYSQNISAGTSEQLFRPSTSLFPNKHLNISAIEATAYAMERNVFRLYHPKTFDPKNATTYDMSDPFHVIRSWEDGMIKRAVRNKGNADDKKLAIGVGVGVGVAWFVAFLVSWYTSAWFERRSLAKKGFLVKQNDKF